MATESTDRLIRLKDMKGHKVAAGDHDIRGWDVVSSDHKKIGSVDDLVVDTREMKVRYAILRVDHRLLESRNDSHMLLPIAGAALDPEDKRVYLEQIDSERLLSIPAYDHRRITRDYERMMRDMFRWGDEADRRERANFYDHPAYREGRMYRRRSDEEVRNAAGSTPPAASDTTAGERERLEVDEKLLDDRPRTDDDRVR